MVKMMTVLAGGVLLGAALIFAVLRFEQVGSLPPGDDNNSERAAVPVSAQTNTRVRAAAQSNGVSNAAEPDTSQTEFTRAAALYARARHSDSAGLQEMIVETNARIDAASIDDAERTRRLTILFFRLAEIAPRTALVLARSGDFAGIKAIEQTVWRAWARVDFEDALFEAKTQTTRAYQNSAAQSLYAAYGYMESAAADRIEDELGIGPDRATRGRYLYQLADRSAADAIDFINGIERDNDRRQYVAWLAYYVSLRDPHDALRSAELFAASSDGEYFSSIISRGLARDNPQATIERLLADGITDSARGEFQSALGALARTDIEAAKQYLTAARSSEERRTLGSAIAAEMARNDPIAAIAWARANDTGLFPYLQMAAVTIVARSDPELAMAEALKVPNSQARSNIVSTVLQQLAQRDPADAVVLLDRIQNEEQRRSASRQLASSWMRKDPDAALDWILSRDEATVGPLISTAMSRLVNRDLDAAIRLLPRVEEGNQSGVRRQIALQLASNRSPDEAQLFIQQFEGQQGYDELQASVITGVAQTDIMMAKQLADQLPLGDARDRAYTQVISQRAQTNPAEAVRWLRSVDNEALRGAATGQLAAMWAASDPVAAERWVSGLPSGSSRDDAIVQISSAWRELTDEQRQLIAGIEDRDKRGQAKIRQVYYLMRSDPAAARRLLKDEDIPSYQRQQVEVALAQQRY